MSLGCSPVTACPPAAGSQEDRILAESNSEPSVALERGQKTLQVVASQEESQKSADPSLQDMNLQRIWGRVLEEIAEANLSDGGIPRLEASAQEIRTWMQKDQSVLKKIHVLHLDHLNLTCIPEEIGLFTHLQRLALGDNLLEVLPPDVFGRLGALQELSLNGNRLGALSQGVFNGLVQLQGLYLANNLLETLPAGVFQGLGQLQRLYLTANRIRILRRQMFNGLDSLRWLCLAHNRIKELPHNVFGGLGKLQGLALQHNRLESLSPGIFEELSHLQGLELHHNALKSLPYGVFNGLTRLQAVALEGNPMKGLYPRINHDMSKKMLQKLYWGLGKENKWRECIDGAFHQLGKFVFDQGLHGGTVEPGFIGSMEEAFTFVERFLGEKIDANWYLTLQRHTCAHFNGDPTAFLMGQEKVGVFRDDDDPTQCVLENQYYVSPRAKAEFEAEDARLKREFGPTYGLGEMVHVDSRQLTVQLIYKVMGREQVLRIFNKYLTRFYVEVESADNPDAKLMAIAKLQQKLEWLHPLRDGTARTSTALMNKFLTDYGFHPAILEWPHVSSSYTLAQWKEYLQNGLVKWEQEYTRSDSGFIPGNHPCTRV